VFLGFDFYQHHTIKIKKTIHINQKFVMFLFCLVLKMDTLILMRTVLLLLVWVLV